MLVFACRTALQSLRECGAYASSWLHTMAGADPSRFPVYAADIREGVVQSRVKLGCKARWCRA